MAIVPVNPHRGFTLLEFLIAAAIVAILASFMLPAYQKYSYRAKAGGVIVEAEPIQRAVHEIDSTVDRPSYRLQLENAPDGSIIACQAPAGAGCSDASARPAQVIATPERLLIAGGTIRVSAAPCYVDCPRYALKFSSDVAVTGTGAPPAAPRDPGAGPPGKDGGKGKGNDQDKGGGKGGGPPGQADGGARHPRRAAAAASHERAWPVASLVSSAHAMSVAHAADGGVERTNRILYEFGEVMRGKAHASDNATCLFDTGPCTVTIKY